MKIFSINILSFAAFLSLAACGGTDSSTTSLVDGAQVSQTAAIAAASDGVSVVQAVGPTATPQTLSIPSLAFNQNSWPADTSGTLPGTVLFAQSQILPTTPRIANDVQPHITGLRDTLVLFKADPSVQLAEGKSIVLMAFDADSRPLGSITMSHPNDIPKTPFFLKDVDLSTFNFDTNLSKPREINTQAELTKLNDPNAVFLKALLATNSSVRISLNDGRWVSDIYLPDGDYTGKKIVLNKNATYGTTVRYSKAKNGPAQLSIPNGTSTAFAPVGRAGGWASQADVDHSSYVYGQNFWTAKLAKEWTKPGLRLDFVQGTKSGSLNFAANGKAGVMMGAPTELLLHVIDIGMLTPPKGQFVFAKDDTAHQEYFQTMPVSRMIVGRYESVYFDTVVLPTGEVLNASHPEPTIGGVYTGMLREFIGKELVSLGINNANFGISSSKSSGGSYPYWTAQITAHTSRGLYQNGIVDHGLSGGGGVATLYGGVNNELSHELGHNYGLGHFEGNAKGSIHKPANDVNSTWGWDSKRNVFIPNFTTSLKTKTASSPSAFPKDCFPYASTLADECVEPFKVSDDRAYGFNWDSMAGGDSKWPSVNRLTLYTPNSTQKIQKFLESKAVFDKSSSTGFRKWNPQTLQMDEVVMSLPDTLFVSANPNPANTSTSILYTQYLQTLFDKGADVVTLGISNSGWRKEVVLPSASANANKFFIVDHKAQWGTTLIVDGVTINSTLETPKRVFKSDGSKWAQLDQFVEPQWVRKPELFGVPVVTIVGFYDPQKTLTSYVYPALHGAYGYVYPSENLNPSSKGCLVQVFSNNGSVRRYKLKSYRFTDGQMNRFQVNIPQSEGARSAEVVCDGVPLALRDLDPAKDPASLTYTVNGMPLRLPK